MIMWMSRAGGALKGPEDEEEHHGERLEIKKTKGEVAPLMAPLMFIEVLVDDAHVIAMLDSGATINAVGPELVIQLKCEEVSLPKLYIVGWGGHRSTYRWVKILLTLRNGHLCQIVAVVNPDFGSALLLGMPFIRAVKGVLDTESNLFKTKEGFIPTVEMGDFVQSNRVLMSIVATLKEEDSEALRQTLENNRLTEQQNQQLAELLIKYGDLWVGDPRGETPLLKCELKVNSSRPIVQKPRRWTADQAKIIDEEVAKMIAEKVIQPSQSSFVQEPVLIKKKDGKWRFCIDFRQLNSITESDQFPLPRIHKLIQHVRDSSHFITFDLRAGYWQILMDEGSIQYTAFRAHHQLYEYRVMPFGLKTAPACFSRLMQLVLGNLYWRGVCVYLDNILIHHTTFAGLLELTNEVLERLRSAKLTLSFKKCQFCPKSLLYLGHILEGGALKPNLQRIEPLRRLSTPKTVREVRALLGFLGYFRIFIPWYANLAEPLNKLLRKRVKFHWGEDQEQAKDNLINSLVDMVLSNPLEGTFFRVETDASDIAISGALYISAREDGPWKPVEFMSKHLNEVQQRWPVYEREGFAIVHSMEKFDWALRGRKFEVYTDSYSLKWMQTATMGKVARWASRLAEYEMTIIYRPGKTNVVADFLSRYIKETSDEFIPSRATCWTLQATVPKMEDIIDHQKVERPPEGRNYVKKEGIIYYMNRIWVPPSLRMMVVERFHNLVIYHHPGVRRTVAAIRRVFN